MKKRQLKNFKIYSVAIVLVLVGAIFGIYAAVDKAVEWQPAEEISVNVDGFTGTLQEAIDAGTINGSGPFSVGSASEIDPGHSFEEVLVSVNGNEKTLKQALSDGGLCGTTNPATSYSSDPNPGHTGTEIEVTDPDGNVKSFQEAINDGSVAKADGGWSDWGDTGDTRCSLSCSDGYQTGGLQEKEQTRSCTNPEPYCGGADCTGDSTRWATTSTSCDTGDCYLGGSNIHHTYEQCLAAGGSVYDTGNGIHICKFSGSSCPSKSETPWKWVQYEDWSATNPVSGNTAAVKKCENDYYVIANTESHSFSNNPREALVVYQERDFYPTGLPTYLDCGIPHRNSNYVYSANYAGTKILITDEELIQNYGDSAAHFICDFPRSGTLNVQGGTCSYGAGGQAKRSATQIAHEDYEENCPNKVEGVCTYTKYATITEIGCV